VDLYARTQALSELSPEFERLGTAREEIRQEGFLHYMTATHAGYYDAYERALGEIDVPWPWTGPRSAT